MKQLKQLKQLKQKSCCYEIVLWSVKNVDICNQKALWIIYQRALIISFYALNEVTVRLR